MKQILYHPDVEIYLNELVNILYENNYFGLKSSAIDYVGWIIDTIEQDIDKVPHKPAPLYFQRYGKSLSYSVFKRNQNRQWYVFFNLEGDVYYIRYIANNHTIAQYLNDEK